MNRDNYWTTRRVSRRTWLRGAGIGAAGLAGAALIGCGSSGNATATPAAGGGGATGGATGTATAAPKSIPHGGTLDVANGLEPSSLDPQKAVSGGDDYYYNGIFETLVAYDQNSQLDKAKGLSESFEVVDQQTITFHLRKGIKFHDGSDFTSESVQFSIARAQDPKFGSIAFSSLKSVASVETPDPNTATFKLNKPDPDLVYNLGSRYGGWMMSKSAVEAAGSEVGAKPVGTGPFQFGEWVSGSRVTWKRNPGYWRKDANGETLPYLDGVNIHIIADSTTAIAALLNGDVAIAGVSGKDLPKVQGNSDFNLLKREGTGLPHVLIFNKSIPPFDNVDLRRAIVWAVDAKTINKSVYLDTNIVADGWGYPPGTWAYKPIAGRPTFDLNKAKGFLQSSGKSGASFDSMVYSSPTVVQQAEVVQEQLRQIGLNMNIVTEDVGQATTDFFSNHKTPMYSTGWSLKVVPDTLVSPTLSKDGFYNPAKDTDPELQAMIDQAKTEYDQAKRVDLYTKIGAYAMDQALYVPMLYGVSHVGVAKKVGGQDSLWTNEARLQYDGAWLQA